MFATIKIIFGFKVFLKLSGYSLGYGLDGSFFILIFTVAATILQLRMNELLAKTWLV